MKSNGYVNVKKLMEGEKPVHCASCRRQGNDGINFPKWYRIPP